MKTAVVILNWNGLDLLKKFLPYTISRTGNNASIIVVDNGSEDASVKWLKESYPGIRIIENGENLGFAGGYNRALDEVNSEYFVLLNSDIEVTANWLDPVIELMDNDTKLAACQPKILSYHNRHFFEHAGAAGGFIDKYGYPFCRGRIFDSVEEDSGQYNNGSHIFWASGACLFIRSSAWKEARGFDENFFAHMEEIDLCWRLQKLGYNIRYAPDSKVYHVGGGTLPYSSPLKIYYNFRNNLFMLHKNLPEQNFRRIMFRRKILDGIAALKFMLSFKFNLFNEVIKAHRSYYKHRPYLEKWRNTPSEDTNNPFNSSKLVFRKSIVSGYYLKGKKTFRSVWPLNDQKQ